MLKLAFLVLTIALVGTVWARGGRDERTTVLALVLASVVSPLLTPRHFHAPDGGLVLVDLALFAWLVHVALASDRFWPLWAAGFQLAGATVNLARLAEPNAAVLAYSNAEIFWAYPVCLSVIAGALVEAPARREPAPPVR